MEKYLFLIRTYTINNAPFGSREDKEKKMLQPTNIQLWNLRYMTKKFSSF